MRIASHRAIAFRDFNALYGSPLIAIEVLSAALEAEAPHTTLAPDAVIRNEFDTLTRFGGDAFTFLATGFDTLNSFWGNA